MILQNFKCFKCGCIIKLEGHRQCLENIMPIVIATIRIMVRKVTVQMIKVFLVNFAKSFSRLIVHSMQLS